MIDVIYTAIGAFYGGGGAELNPIFARYSDPKDFVLFVLMVKLFVISGLLLGLTWLSDYEETHITKWADLLGLYSNSVYGFALLGVIGLNIFYQYGI